MPPQATSTAEKVVVAALFAGCVGFAAGYDHARQTAPAPADECAAVIYDNGVAIGWE